ncbi:fimbrial biogenesis outer membrane usher protein [Synechocystis sp. FACHB-383]|uniref:fimbria/pilus outer membrane usher protein n=1 Tax=Synechocystis sp. FACHB-383 TaxID=2692864 RepID=UPI0016826130|nr:fimbria/pilus outer membrane usher protein [Synechocystis sp. FACHB-383]MBD2653746.1 fimbrial biogenesis outer membrane usher protein [Synechocystis sp. FACHB-383]
MVFRFYSTVLAIIWSNGLITVVGLVLAQSARAETFSADFTPPDFAVDLLLGQGTPVMETTPPEQGQTEEDNQTATPSEPTPANLGNEDDLFERVFGRPRPTGVQRLVAPFFINDLQQGQIVVFVSLGGSSSLQITASTLLSKMEEYARPDIQARLADLVDNSGNLTLAALQSVGLDATFNDQLLELRIIIPPNLRKTIVYGSGNLQLPPGAATALRPSNFSGFVNLIGTQPYAWDGTGDLGRQALNLGVEGALNYQGWVLEGSASFAEQSNNPWTRSDIRLVKDDPDNAIRYVLGDLFSTARSYQSFVPMVGFAMFRNFSLQPYLTTRPTGQFEFLLESPARVEIFVNGLLRQTLQLPAGPQDIRNFGLNTGLNNVTVKITDSAGRVEELSFSAPLATDLLEVGLNQFGLGVGVPAYTTNGVRNYDTSRPIIGGFYRQGITSTLTLGGYLQAAGSQQVIGMEGTLATSVGNFGWDAALENDGNGLDHAFRLRYQFLALGGNQARLPNFGLEVEYLGPYFQRFGSFPIGFTPDPLDFFGTATNDISWSFGANYSQTLIDGLGINLGLGYQLGSFGQPNAYRAAIGFTTNLGRGLQVNLTLNNRLDQSGQTETQVLFNFLQTSQFQSLTARSNLSSQREQASTLTWTSRSPAQYNSVNTTVNLSNNPNPGYFGTGLGLTYRGFVGDINLNHDYDQSSHRTNLNFGTALVYADGRFGWSRPVRDSFVIFSRNPNFADQLVLINPGLYGPVAEANYVGPGVVPDLSSYTLTTMRVDAPNMPLGYDLGNAVFNLLPSYKSGTLITVGTESTVFLRGTLVDQAGEPIALQVGQVRSLSDPSWSPLELFTNRAGRFALTGLGPGEYELQLFSDPPRTIRFEIPADKTGIYDMGTVTVGD